MKTLETYRTGLEKETWLLLSTDSEFLKYLKGTNEVGRAPNPIRRTAARAGAGRSRLQELA